MKQQLIRGAIIAFAIGATCALGSATAQAEMVMVTPSLSDAERVIVEQNPALSELAVSAPDDLRRALDLIATALANPSKTRGGLDDLDSADVKLLGQNPALLQVWRSSPEASADLLELIRTAAGSGKPQK